MGLKVLGIVKEVKVLYICPKTHYRKAPGVSLWQSHP